MTDTNSMKAMCQTDRCVKIQAWNIRSFVRESSVLGMVEVWQNIIPNRWSCQISLKLFPRHFRDVLLNLIKLANPWKVDERTKDVLDHNVKRRETWHLDPISILVSISNETKFVSGEWISLGLMFFWWESCDLYPGCPYMHLYCHFFGSKENNMEKPFMPSGKCLSWLGVECIQDIQDR